VDAASPRAARCVGRPRCQHLTHTETCSDSRRALPSSLLLLSRAFTVTAPVAGRPAEADLQMESLKDTLGALNREVVDEVGFEVGDIGCETLTLNRTLTPMLEGWGRCTGRTSTRSALRSAT